MKINTKKLYYWQLIHFVQYLRIIYFLYKFFFISM